MLVVIGLISCHLLVIPALVLWLQASQLLSMG